MYSDQFNCFEQEAQLTKKRSSSTLNDPSTSRNFAAILKAEMAIRSIPSSGRGKLNLVD
jgi:hypothetical protein